MRDACVGFEKIVTEMQDVQSMLKVFVAFFKFVCRDSCVINFRT